MDNAVEELKELCQNYIRDMVEAARIDKEPAKLFGAILGGNRETQRCSNIFADKVELLFTRISDPEELGDAADYILTLAIRYKDDLTLGLMFLALLSFVTPKLTDEGLPNGKALLQRTVEAFPKYRCTPSMKAFIKRLREVNG